MVQLNTLQIEILKAENGFSVGINRPFNQQPMFDPMAMANAIKIAQGKTPGDEWKDLMEDEPLMTVKEKPQSSLLVFADFDQLVEYLRNELV